MIVDQLTSLVDDTSALEPWTLTGAELREVTSAALRARAGLDALISSLAATAATMGLPKEDGASSTTAWLAGLSHGSRLEAARLVAVGTKVSDRTEATRQAWATGRIGTDQASVILTALDQLPDWVDDEPFAVAQAHLLSRAAEVSLDDLKRDANHVLEVVDPDGADEALGEQLRREEERARKATRFTIGKRGDGCSRGSFTIADADADVLRAAIEGIIAPRRASANAERWGITTDDFHALPRDEKMGHAFTELVNHLPTDALPQSGGLAATVAVMVRVDDLRTGQGTATTTSGTTTSAARAQRTACNARLVAMYLDSESRVLDLGTSKRIYDRHQRLVLAARDGGCTWPGCDRPPAWCEAHHLDFWSEDGPTDLDNAALMCHFHHFLVHEGEWAARMADDGVVEVVPPRRVDPHQVPRRHARFARQPRAA